MSLTNHHHHGSLQKSGQLLDFVSHELSWNDVSSLMGELRAMARRLLRFEAHAQSLQTMGLVLSGLRRQKLSDQAWGEVNWADREQFLAAMYRSMDRALKDHGRRRAAQKRKVRQWIAIEDLPPSELVRTADFQPHELERVFIERPEVVEALAEALDLLERDHPDWACIARHRYYGALTIEQTARLMGIAERTVRRHWEKARILLHEEVLRVLCERGYDVQEFGCAR
jgi:RNA polymerase sigma factor (sigma-70 family)